MSRLTNDIDAINQAVSQNVTSLIASVLSLVGIVVAMFLLNHWLALATLLIVPIMAFFTNFIATYTRKGFRELQKQLGGMNSVMEEAISGQKVVKAFRRNESVIEAFRERNQAVYQAAISANVYAMMLMPLSNVLGNFFVIVLASLGGYLALQGLVSVGMIATFINYGKNFIDPLQQLANMFNAIQAALAGAERVFEIIDTPPEVQDAPDALPLEETAGACVLRRRGIRLRAGHADHQEHDPGSQSRADHRPGGADRGGQDHHHQPAHPLLRDPGRADQHRWHRSARYQERRPAAQAGAGAARYLPVRRHGDGEHPLRAAGGDGRGGDPGGQSWQMPITSSASCRTATRRVLSERASNLSQGQRQLLAIARAILADPAILILDEATSSVDTRTEARIQKSLLRLMEGRTSFVIAHRLSTIRDADNVVVIDKGEIVEQGTHQQLLDKRGFYHHLYLSQFKGQAI